MAEIALLEVAIITNLGLMLVAFIVLGKSVNNTIQQHTFQTHSSGCIEAPELVKDHIFHQLVSVGLFLVAFTIPFAVKLYLIIRRRLGSRWLAGSVMLSGVFTLVGFVFQALSVSSMIHISLGDSFCDGYSKSSFIVMGIICYTCLAIFSGAFVYGVVKAKEAKE
ncbi:hypothetical protein PIB30_005077 [Stylosanthes scabra]|uniref:Integral membrane protein n=1 Tax=Stylosanthes scabra TaxID=79078 RepID=A0ABU6Z4P3_9FABA|nr:hypothetical protein [Stylosanthes scabra]